MLKQTKVCRDELAEKLRCLLERLAFDGTECHRVIDAELRGAEHEVAASAIRHKVLSQYHDTIPIDAVKEIVGKLLDDGELP